VLPYGVFSAWKRKLAVVVAGKIQQLDCDALRIRQNNEFTYVGTLSIDLIRWTKNEPQLFTLIGLKADERPL
jgi:hypothetical protein